MDASIHNFAQNKQNAIEQLREMNRRATAPDPDCKKNNREAFQKNFISSINIPSDALLILGLILILSKENSDNMLIFALLYILA